jgi:transposase
MAQYQHKIPRQLTLLEFNTHISMHIPYGQRGPSTSISWHEIFNYILFVLDSGIKWSQLPIRLDPETNKPVISYTRIHSHFMRLITHDCVNKMFICILHKLDILGFLDISIMHGDGTSTVAKAGGDNIGYNGYKHHKGDKVIAICDRNRNVIAPLVAAPGNASEMKLLPDSLRQLKQITQTIGLSIEGSIMSLDGGYDSKANRKHIFNAGMTPNINENPRNRQATKRGRKRKFDQSIANERFETIERVFAWEDTFRRLIVRHEKKSIVHYAFKIIAYTMINLRNIIRI